MVQVTVSEGILEGELVDNEYGGKFYSFKGIPYAEPPLGDLRFKAPQPKKPWKGVRSAKEFGPVCCQYDHFAKESKPGSEDCLFINVYTPELKPSKPLPVMFWIHGGGFFWGSGNDDMYGPEFLVRQDVILVTFNYRLEVLGFLCLDTEDVPGNAGMKDQVAALRWVKTNISKFGGNPDNITIFGESAGGASVSYHLVSPMTKGLFKRAILQSGSATSCWAQAFEPRRRAIALAKKLGSNSDDDKELYNFFKSLPAHKFIGSNVPITLYESSKVGIDLHFSVVSEKKFGNNERFFSGNLDDALRNGIHENVEVMSGHVPDESGVTLAFGDVVNAAIAQANSFLEYFVPKPISLKCPMTEQLVVGAKIKKFYFKNEDVSESSLEQLLKFLSFSFIIYPILKIETKIAETNKNKLYAYKFSCVSERNFFKNIFEIEKLYGDRTAVVCHCDDLAYLFPIKLRPQKIYQKSRTFKMIDQVTTLWTNFAKYGDPTPDNKLGVKWPQYTVAQRDYLDIGEKLVPGTALEREEFELFNNIYREYLQC